MKKSFLHSLDKETRLFLFILSGVAAVLVVLAGTTVFGIYKKGWENTTALVVSSIIPLPAATVDGETLQYDDYLQNLNSLKRFHTKQLEQGDFEQPDEQQLREEALERLVFDHFVQQIADELDIRISDAEVDAEIASIAQLRGSRAELETFLREWYGWSVQDYADRFLRPALLYEAVNETIQDSFDENIEAAATMNVIEQKLNDGEDFAEVARAYSADSGQETTGEIFVMVRGSFPSHIEDELIVTPVGEYTDVLTLDRSLQIIKVEGRDAISGLLQLRRIYLPLKTVEDVVLERRSQATIINYIF